MLFNVSIYGFHILLFLVVFNSSLKYMYSSGVWNLLQIILALFILAITFMDKKNRVIINPKTLLVIIGLSAATLVSFFYQYAFYDSKVFFKFITLSLLMFCGVCYGRHLNVISFMKISNVFIVVFILYFSVLKIAVMDESANYLMYSIAIAFVAVANMGIAFYKDWDGKWLSCGLILLLYCFTLHSRSAIVLPMFFLLFFIFIDHVKKKKLLKLIGTSSTLIAILGGIAIYSDITLEDLSQLGYGAYRLISMLSGEYADDRGVLLYRSLQLISDNPLGYGIGAFWSLLGYYPHNFFVETALNFGVFVCLGYFVISCIAVIELSRSRIFILWFYALIYLYYLAAWMTSFDYLSSFQIHFALGCFISCLSLDVPPSSVALGSRVDPRPKYS